MLGSLLITVVVVFGLVVGINFVEKFGVSATR
jgi:lipopolysaccharide export LptBFGC system permease protein LptF